MIAVFRNATVRQQEEFLSIFYEEYINYLHKAGLIEDDYLVNLTSIVEEFGGDPSFDEDSGVGEFFSENYAMLDTDIYYIQWKDFIQDFKLARIKWKLRQ